MCCARKLTPPIVKGNSVDTEIRNTQNTWEMGEDLANSFVVILTEDKEIECEVIFKTNTNSEFVDTDVINIGKVLSIFLSLYLTNLNPDEEIEGLEDGEFIARLPEVIATDSYEGKIIDLLSPMTIFWEEYISPVVLDYVELSNPSGICLPLIETEGF